VNSRVDLVFPGFNLEDHPDLDARLRKQITKVIRPGITTKEKISAELLKDRFLLNDLPHLLNKTTPGVKEVQANPSVYSSEIITRSVEYLHGRFWRKNSTHTRETVVEYGNCKEIYNLLARYPGLPMKWIQNFARLTKDQVYGACGLLVGFNKIYYLDRNGIVVCIAVSHDGNKGVEKRDFSKKKDRRQQAYFYITDKHYKVNSNNVEPDRVFFENSSLFPITKEDIRVLGDKHFLLRQVPSPSMHSKRRVLASLENRGFIEVDWFSYPVKVRTLEFEKQSLRGKIVAYCQEHPPS
jgi:hypothetical protein